ncbi:hypothetical protein E5Q_05059 [Mixia osmundae IAM 14324]|uniref:Uncharacterized protein n=1 Tax=Mixia osmundae (strain CBS 9802 / IAM 14324 / JCM 22182 / KY 12970) TaxID=764103 RepID=G7E6B3_MIXOS|nr:hypothetical protein E5Q_05059 [Mixia osmundae IAM 14324]
MMLAYFLCALFSFLAVAASPDSVGQTHQLAERAGPIEILGFELGGPGQAVYFMKTLQIVYNPQTGLFEAGQLFDDDIYQQMDGRCKAHTQTGILWSTKDSKGNNVEIDFVLYHHVAVTDGFRVGEDSYDGLIYFNDSHIPIRITSSRGVVAGRHLFSLVNYGPGTW